MNYSVRSANSGDVDEIADIHRETFPRQRDSEVWIRATLAAWPRMLVYVLTSERETVGYIFWTQKSGIRPSAIIELDQVAIREVIRGQGLGELMIRESLALVRGELKKIASL